MSIVENAQSSMLSRQEVKPHLKRKDWPGLLYLAIHFSMVGGTGYLVYLATGTQLDRAGDHLSRIDPFDAVSPAPRVHTRDRIQVSLAE